MIDRISGNQARELDNIGNQAREPTVNLTNLLGIPEPEITDKDAIQAHKVEAIIQELEAMMKEREIVGKDTVPKSSDRVLFRKVTNRGLPESVGSAHQGKKCTVITGHKEVEGLQEAERSGPIEMFHRE